VLRLAEILLEPRRTASWDQLRQIGVEEAVGVLRGESKSDGAAGRVPVKVKALDVRRIHAASSPATSVSMEYSSCRSPGS